MGGAMAEGLIKGDYINNEDICISDPSRQQREYFANMGITATPSNQLAAQGADVVCVVVKPWLVEQVLKGIKEVLDYEQQILVVVAAGVKSEAISQWLNKDGKMIPTFLVIPNIAIAQLQSMTFIVPCADVQPQHTEQVKALFDAMGQTIITEESARCCRASTGHRPAPRSSHRPRHHTWRCNHQGFERDGTRRVHVERHPWSEGRSEVRYEV